MNPAIEALEEHGSGMTDDELKRLRILYDKMKFAADMSRTGMIDVILMPWIKELHDILEPYHE